MADSRQESVQYSMDLLYDTIRTAPRPDSTLSLYLTLRACAPSFYPLYHAPPRPNTRPRFNVVGLTPLHLSPSPLHLPAWEHMLVNYLRRRG
jgi:hypothetical protein